MEERFTIEELKGGLEAALDNGDYAAADNLADRIIALEDYQEAEEISSANHGYEGLGSYSTAMQGGMAVGAANMAQNIYNAGRWAYNQVAPDEYELSDDTFIDQGIDWVQDRGQQMIDYSGHDGFIKDLVVGAGKEIPGYYGASRLFKGATTTGNRILQEGKRVGLATGLTQDVQEDLGDFAADAAIGGTIGMVAEGALPAYRAIRGSELDEAAVSHFQKQYQEIKNKVDNPFEELTEKDALDLKLLDANGNDVGIDYRFARNVNEIADTVLSNNQKGGLTGVETIKDLLGDDVRLAHYGIKPSKSENLYNWMADKVGKENLQLFGMAEFNISPKRAKAMMGQIDDFQQSLKMMAAENPNLFNELTTQWNSIAMLMKKGLNGDRQAFRQADSMIQQIEDRIAPSSKSYKRSEFFKTIHQYNRHMRTLMSLSRKTKNPNKYSAFTSLATISGIGALSPSVILPAALVGARYVGGKAMSAFSSRHLRKTNELLQSARGEIYTPTKDDFFQAGFERKKRATERNSRRQAERMAAQEAAERQRILEEEDAMFQQRQYEQEAEMWAEHDDYLSWKEFARQDELQALQEIQDNIIRRREEYVAAGAPSPTRQFTVGHPQPRTNVIRSREHVTELPPLGGRGRLPQERTIYGGSRNLEPAFKIPSRRGRPPKNREPITLKPLTLEEMAELEARRRIDPFD